MNDKLLTLLTTEEAAEMLQMSPASLAQWRSRELGPPYIKFEGTVRYQAEEIGKWLKSRAVKPGRPGSRSKGSR